MSYHIKELFLDESFDRYTIESDQRTGAKRLSNISKINILVGENNSGKSLFLRKLATMKTVNYVPHLHFGNGWTWDMLCKVIEEFRSNFHRAFTSQGVLNADNLRSNLDRIPTPFFLQDD